MTMRIPPAMGIPRAVAKAMELLRWGDWPHCGPLEGYRADAGYYASLRDRIRRGKENRDAVRRGP